MSRKRMQPILAVTKGTWEGTADIVEAIVEESRFTYGWRAARSAALMAIADDAPRIWMFGHEFEAWRAYVNGGKKWRKNKASPEDMIGVSRVLGTRYIRGVSVIPKTVALACAHVALGLEMPVAPGDSDAFSAWAYPRFGSMAKITQWLGRKDAYITDRCRGYDIRGDERIPKSPEADLVRALDWVLRMGPRCPYGEAIKVSIFPSQAEGETLLTKDKPHAD